MTLDEKAEGVLSREQLERLFDNGVVKRGRNQADKKTITPAGIDLVCGERYWSIPRSFKPSTRETIQETLKKNDDIKCLKIPAEGLELKVARTGTKGWAYLVEIEERLELPEWCWGHSSTRSSIGRIDLKVRLLADGVSVYDDIPLGYKGKIYLVVEPQSFNVVLRPGDSIANLRLYSGRKENILLHDRDIIRHNEYYTLIMSDDGKKHVPALFSGLISGIMLGIDLSRDIVALMANPTPTPIDLSKRNYYKVADFFEVITKDRLKKGLLEVALGRFYLTASNTKIRIPPLLSAEMLAYLPMSGEVRNHEAAFFDPGFGYGDNGEINGANAVFELKPKEDQTYAHGAPVSLLVFQWMAGIPQKVAGSYMSQEGVTLPKYFKPLEG